MFNELGILNVAPDTIGLKILLDGGDVTYKLRLMILNLFINFIKESKIFDIYRFLVTLMITFDDIILILYFSDPSHRTRFVSSNDFLGVVEIQFYFLVEKKLFKRSLIDI